MKRVFKYPLAVTDLQSVSLPRGARLLHVMEQQGQWQLWALVDSDEVLREDRYIRIAGTGHPINEFITAHISTFKYEPGMVFHAFEVV